MEQFKNFGETTLAADYTAAGGVIDVVAVGVFPTLGTFHVVLGNAQKTVLRVEDPSGPIIVTAVENDANAAAGTTVKLVMTAQTMDALKKDQVQRASFFTFGQFGVFPGKEGVLHLFTDGPFLGRNKAADNVPPDLYYGLFPAGLINVGNFNILNAGTAVVTGAGGIAIMRTLVENPTEGIHGRHKATVLPSGPFTRTVGLILEPTYIAGATPIRAGLYLRESATGKIITVGCKLDGTNGVRQGEVIRWDAPATINAIQVTSKRLHYLPSPLWYRAQRSGANLILSMAVERFFFVTLETALLAAFFTTEPDQAGFFVENETVTAECATTFISWEEA